MKISRDLFPYFTIFIFLVGLVIVVFASLIRTDSFLVYTLDDPYIHLALAQSILEGGYGINQGEYASPSSSVLYPLLLTVTLALGLGTYGPLIIASAFALLSVWIIARFAAHVVPEDEGLVSLITSIAMSLAIVFALNAIALPMNGMEHTIHIFGVALALTALHDLLLNEDESRIWRLFLGCLVCATIRFEGMALVAGVVLVLSLGGYWRTALSLVAVIGVVLATYGSYMVSLGLPFFPSSVMTKSNVAAEASEGSLFGFATSLIRNFLDALQTDRGIVMGIVAAMAFAFCLDAKSPKGLRLLLVAILVLLAGHLVAGRFGWFDRYEIYAVAAMLMLGLALLRHYNDGHAISVLVVAMAALAYSVSYGLTTARSPAAAASIYQQQYQMHRFAQDFFPAPVAVNDLGWVAYDNQNYVLDLWGLGSEEARQLTATGGWTKEKLSEITQRNNIAYAMIYADLFEEIPDDWCRAAQLITSRVTAASDTVSFYLLKLTQNAAFSEALNAFSKSLPKGARLEITPC